MDDTSHDQLTRKTPETGSLDTLDDRSYSSSSVVPMEQLEKVNGKSLDITNVDGDTPEEKLKNLEAAVEGQTSAHLILRREVGPFHAEVRRGWDEDTKSQYENIMVREATKNVKIPGFDETTLKNIRVGLDEGPKADVPMWGTAEFESLNITRPTEAVYAKALEEAREKVSALDGINKVTSTFKFEGRTVTLEVSNNPEDKAKWEGQDFHLYTEIPFEDNPEILRATLPSLSFGRKEPDERPLAGYAMYIRNIAVDLSKKSGVIGRAFFSYKLIDRNEVQADKPEAA